MEDVQDADQNEEVKEETRQKRAPRTRKQSRKSSAKSGWGDDKNSRKARVQRASDSIQEDGPEAQVPSTNIRTVGDSKEESMPVMSNALKSCRNTGLARLK